MTIAKVCGIRTIDEGRAALEAGADWLGFVFWPGTFRYVPPETAAQIVAALRTERQGWSAVGVFVDPDPDEAARIHALCQLDVVQLSGHEDAALVEAMPAQARTMKALHVKPGREAAAADVVKHNRLGADLYLLDTHADGQYGGTGVPFDWQALRGIGSRCLVGGGLRPDNVHDALSTLSPLGVDVSSGVELADKSGKDPTRVRAFLQAVRDYDREASAMPTAFAAPGGSIRP